MSSITSKFENIFKKYKKIENEMGKPEVLNNPKKYQELSIEHGNLKGFAESYLEWKSIKNEIKEQKEMLNIEKDAEIIEMINNELPELEKTIEKKTEKLKKLLIPESPMDRKNAILEIRAGTGGEEAGLFAAEIYRMYVKYSESMGWSVEQMLLHSGKVGNSIKEVVISLSGKNVYGKLKYEGGVHRVQRVPETESGGRIHTSAVTVAVLPEADSMNEVEIDPSDLKIDVFKASGAGGQHVNTTDSAVRITHEPSGVVVSMQEERSQIQNRRKAMKILTSKLLRYEEERHMKERTEKRRSIVGSGDRSEKIRTYNFPQGRITDHRLPLTLYSLESVMEGNLEPVLNPVVEWHNAELLEEVFSGDNK